MSADAMREWEEFPRLPGRRLQWERHNRERNLTDESGSVLAVTKLGLTGALTARASVGDTSYIRRKHLSLAVDDMAAFDNTYWKPHNGELFAPASNAGCDTFEEWEEPHPTAPIPAMQRKTPATRRLPQHVMPAMNPPTQTQTGPAEGDHRRQGI